jgi:hypothetical protein
MLHSTKSRMLSMNQRAINTRSIREVWGSQMNKDASDCIPIHPDLYDIEGIMAEARRGYDPRPRDRWNTTVQIAKELLLALPVSSSPSA